MHDISPGGAAVAGVAALAPGEAATLELRLDGQAFAVRFTVRAAKPDGMRHVAFVADQVPEALRRAVTRLGEPARAAA